MINITIQLTVSLIFTEKYWSHISKQLDPLTKYRKITSLNTKGLNFA